MTRSQPTFGHGGNARFDEGEHAGTVQSEPRWVRLRFIQAGTHAHSIQAHQANSDPTSWFPAAVTEIVGDEISVRYDDDIVCGLWHRGLFGARLQIGERVVVCEAWSLLTLRGDDAGIQLSVEVRRETWRKHDLPDNRPRVERPGIVSNETGEGIDRYRGNKPDDYIMELPK